MNAMLLLTKLVQRGGGTEYRYELRQARDGWWYRADQFYDYYGEDEWLEHWEQAERMVPSEMEARVMELMKLLVAGVSQMGQWRDLGDQWAESAQARPDPPVEINDSSETGATSAAPASRSPEKREMPGGLQGEEDQWRETEEAHPQRSSAPQSLYSSGTWPTSAAPAATNEAMATDTGAKPESCMQQALAPRPPPPPPPAVSSVIGPPPGLTLQCQVPPKAKDIDALKAREIEALKRVFYCPLCQVGPVCGVHRGDLEAVVRLDGQCR